MPPTLVERRRATPYDRPKQQRHHRRTNSQSQTHRRTPSDPALVFGAAQRFEAQATGPREIDHCHWESLAELRLKTFYAQLPVAEDPETPSVYLANLEAKDKILDALSLNRGLKRTLSLASSTENGEEGTQVEDHSELDVPFVASPTGLEAEQPTIVQAVPCIQQPPRPTALSVPAWFRPQSPLSPQSSNSPTTPPPLLIQSLAGSPESMMQPEQFDGEDNSEDAEAGQHPEEHAEEEDEDAEGETDDEARDEGETGAEQSWGYHLQCTHTSASAHLRQLLSARHRIRTIYGPSSAFEQLDIVSTTPVDPRRDYRVTPTLPPTLAETYVQLRRMLQRPFPNRSHFKTRIQHTLALKTALPKLQSVCSNCAELEPELAVTLALLDARIRDQSQRLRIAYAQVVCGANSDRVVWAESRGEIPPTPPISMEAGPSKKRRKTTTKRDEDEQPKAQAQGGHKGKWHLSDFAPQSPPEPQVPPQNKNARDAAAATQRAMELGANTPASASASVTQQHAQRAQAQTQAQPPITAPAPLAISIVPSTVIVPTTMDNNSNKPISAYRKRKARKLQKQKEEEEEERLRISLERTQRERELHGMSVPPISSGQPTSNLPPSTSQASMTQQQPQLPAANQARLAAFEARIMSAGPPANTEAEHLVRAQLERMRNSASASTPRAGATSMTEPHQDLSQSHATQRARMQQVLARQAQAQQQVEQLAQLAQLPQAQVATSQTHTPPSQPPQVTSAMIQQAVQQIRQTHMQQAQQPTQPTQQAQQQSRRELGLGRPVKRRRFETTDSAREVNQLLDPSMGSVNAVESQLQPSFATQASFTTQPSFASTAPSEAQRSQVEQMLQYAQQPYQQQLRPLDPLGSSITPQGGSGWGGSVRQSQQPAQQAQQSQSGFSGFTSQQPARVAPPRSAQLSEYDKLTEEQLKNRLRQQILRGEPSDYLPLAQLLGQQQAPTPPMHHPTPSYPATAAGPSNTPGLIPTPMPSSRHPTPGSGHPTPSAQHLTPSNNLTPGSGAGYPGSRQMTPTQLQRSPQPNRQLSQQLTPAHPLQPSPQPSQQFSQQPTGGKTHPFIDWVRGLEKTEERVEFLDHWNETWNRQYAEEERVRMSVAPRPQSQTQPQPQQQPQLPPPPQLQQLQQTQQQQFQPTQQIPPQLAQPQPQPPLAQQPRAETQPTEVRTPTLQELDGLLALLNSVAPTSQDAGPQDAVQQYDFGAFGGSDLLAGFPQQTEQSQLLPVQAQQTAQRQPVPQQQVQQAQQVQQVRQQPVQFQQGQYQPQQDQYQQSQSLPPQPTYASSLGLLLQPPSTPSQPVAQPPQPPQPQTPQPPPAPPAASAPPAPTVPATNPVDDEAPRLVYNPDGTRSIIAHLSSGTRRELRFQVAPGQSDADALAMARYWVQIGNGLSTTVALPSVPAGSATTGMPTASVSAAQRGKRKREEEDKEEEEDEDEDSEEEDAEGESDGESEDAEGSDEE